MGGNGRRGSVVSDKEIVLAAKRGTMLRCRTVSGAEHLGWPAGLDDYHLRLVDAGDQVILLHKGCLESITVTAHVGAPPAKALAFQRWAEEQRSGQSSQGASS